MPTDYDSMRGSPSIVLETLGGWRAIVGGEDIRISPTQFAVIFLLAWRKEQGWLRDELVRLLWPSLPRHRGRRSLSQVLYRLRTIIAKLEISTGNAHIRIRSPRVVVDADQLIQAARAKRYSLALQLYNGPFMPGSFGPRSVHYEQFCDSIRADVEAWTTLALRTVIDDRLSAGDWSSVEVHAARFAESDIFPTDLSFKRILALAGRGQLEDACQLIDRLAITIRRNRSTGVSTALVDTLRRRVNGLKTGAARFSSPTSFFAPFTGRDDEFRLLCDYLGSAQTERQCHVIRLFGDAGVGKSRLAQQVARFAVLHGFRVFWSRGQRLTARLPYGVLADLLHSGLREGDLTFLARDDRRLIALVSQFADSDADYAWDGRTIAPLALFSLATKLFLRIAEKEPLLLVTDDVDWADHISSLFVRYLARRAVDVPLVLMLTGRSKASVRWAAEAEGAVVHDAFPIARFDSQVGAVLVRRCAEQLRLRLPVERVDEIVATANGNALVIVELVRAYASRLPSTDEHVTLRRIDLPVALADHLQDRLNALRSTERRAVSLLALVGRPLTRAQFASLVGVEMIAADRIASVLEARALVSLQGGRVAVVHDAHGAYLASEMTTAMRRQCHSSIADWYATHSRAPAGLMATHLREAGRFTEALTWALVAADTSLHAASIEDGMHYLDVAEACALSENDKGKVFDARIRFHVAANQWQLAFEALDGVEQPRGQGLRRIPRGIVSAVRLERGLSELTPRARLAAHWPELKSALTTEEAGELSGDVVGTVLAAAHHAGQRGMIIDILPDIQTSAERSETIGQRCQLLALAARMHCAHGEKADAMRLSGSALSISSGGGDRIALIRSRGAAGIAELTFGSVRRAVGHYRKVMYMCGGSGLAGFRERYVGDYGWALIEFGKEGAAIECLERAAAEVRSHRVLYVLANLCVALYELALWQKLDHVALRVLELNEITRADWATHAGLAFRGLARFHLGDIDQAVEFDEQLSKSFPNWNNGLGDYSFAVILKCSLLAADGADETAIGLLREQINRWEARYRFGRWRLTLSLAHLLGRTDRDLAWRIARDTAVECTAVGARLLRDRAERLAALAD